MFEVLRPTRSKFKNWNVKRHFIFGDVLLILLSYFEKPYFGQFSQKTVCEKHIFYVNILCIFVT